MSFVYDIKKQLMDIGLEFENKFQKKAQTAPATTGVPATNAPDSAVANPASDATPATPVDAKTRDNMASRAAAVALKLLDNLEAASKDVLPKDIKDLDSLIFFIRKNKKGDKIAFRDSPQASEWIGAVPEAEKASYAEYVTKDGLKFQVSKPRLTQFLQTLQQQAESEKNQIAKVMLGKLVDEANNALKLGIVKPSLPSQPGQPGQQPGHAPGNPETDKLDILPDVLLIDQPAAGEGRHQVTGEVLKSIESVAKFLKEKGIQFRNVKENDQPQAFDVESNEGVCKFVSYLMYRAKTRVMADNVRKMYIQYLSQLPCNIGGTGTGNSNEQGKPDQIFAKIKTALGGMNPLGDPLDVIIIKRFFIVVQETINNTENQAKFKQMLSAQIGATVGDPILEQKMQSIHALTVDGLKHVESVLPLLVKTRIRIHDLKSSVGTNSVDAFKAAVLKPESNTAQHVANTSNVLNNIINRVYALEDELIQNNSFLSDQRLIFMGWRDLLTSVEKAAARVAATDRIR